MEHTAVKLYIDCGEIETIVMYEDTFSLERYLEKEYSLLPTWGLEDNKVTDKVILQ